MATLTPEMLARSGSEFGEQSALFCWVALPETRLKFFDAIKLYSTHQNFADAVKGARAKQIGLRSGVADLFLPVAREGFHGLYIELKIDPRHPVNASKKRKGTLSPQQAAFRDQVEGDGYLWQLCEGWREAAAVISAYLKYN